jgi:hypothetical protein
MCGVIVAVNRISRQNSWITYGTNSGTFSDTGAAAGGIPGIPIAAPGAATTKHTPGIQDKRGRDREREMERERGKGRRRG